MGYASDRDDCRSGDMHHLLDTIVAKVPAPDVDLDGLIITISLTDYDTYTGLIGIGRIQRGSIKTNQPVKIIDSCKRFVMVKLCKYLDLKGFLDTQSIAFSRRYYCS